MAKLEQFSNFNEILYWTTIRFWQQEMTNFSNCVFL